MKLSDTAWLIERERLCLGICDHHLAWVTFTNENAIRFSRRSDAYGLMEALKWKPFKLFDQMQGAIVTEHSWVTAHLEAFPQECEHRLNLSSDATVRCIDCFKSWKIYSSEVAGDLRIQLRRAEQEVVALNKEIENIASGAGAAPPAASPQPKVERHCECSHKESAHIGPNGECEGWHPYYIPPCDCTKFRERAASGSGTPAAPRLMCGNLKAVDGGVLACVFQLDHKGPCSFDAPATPSADTQREREKAIMALQEKREHTAIAAAVAAEREQWQNWCIIEIAVRNTNVASYMDHWEGRALKAEQALERERDECAKIAEAERSVSAKRGSSLSAWDTCNNIVTAIRSRASQPAPHIHTASCYKCGHDDCPCHGGYLHELPMCNPEPQGGKEANEAAERVTKTDTGISATGASSPDASGLLASQSPRCPKCGSDKIDFRQHCQPSWIGCAGCGFAWWPNAETKLADLAQFFPSSSASPKELAGRIARVIEERWNEISTDPAVTLAGVIEQELNR